ncbi:unnamed protein product, partial [Timema podura]|nr:unnamed protein product [Timema podura]
DLLLCSQAFAQRPHQYLSVTRVQYAALPRTSCLQDLFYCVWAALGTTGLNAITHGRLHSSREKRCIPDADPLLPTGGDLTCLIGEQGWNQGQDLFLQFQHNNQLSFPLIYNYLASTEDQV